MRILLNWKWRGPEMVDALEKEGHEVVYHIGIDRSNNFKGVFHYKREAQRGIPAPGIDPNDFPPPGKDIIEKLYEAESVVLSMMNRREGKMVVDERRHLYFEHLRYWHGILKKYQIEAVIFDDVPHAVNTFIILELSKILNIKPLIFQKIRISDRFLLFTDWKEGSVRLRDTITSNTGKVFSVADLADDVREYFELHSNPGNDATPFYMKEKFKKERQNFFRIKRGPFLKALKQRIIKVGRGIYTGTIVKDLYDFTSRKFSPKHDMIMFKEYKNVQKNPDLSRPYVYVALHYQPERTTLPQGGVYNDQLLMIETIAASVPEGWEVYVKEHPVQFQLGKFSSFSLVRYKGYYEQISKIKNVSIVPVDTDTFSLILNSKAVATITGNAGMEALIRQKPVLVFGYPWYQYCSEIFLIRSRESCKKALQEIAGGFKVNVAKIVNFLKCFEVSSFHGYIQIKTQMGTGSKLRYEESMDSLISNLLEELKRK